MRDEFGNPDLKEPHRTDSTAFTRQRKLGFVTCAVLILQKSVKSLQIKLNEFSDYLEGQRVTAGAYTQARAKLSPTLFYDLNKKCYAQRWYDAGDYKRYKGHRLLAVDGSKIRLPDSKTTREEFGSIRIKNQYGIGSYTGAQSSVMYDVFNEFIVDSALAHGKTSEKELAFQHLELCREKDLIIFDRGYSGYELFATITQRNLDFLCRCSKNAFGVVQDFISNEKQKDKVVTLTPCKDIQSKVIQKNLLESLKIRLVKVVLKTGEIEILATSLVDKSKYPCKDFKKLYAARWGVETFFDKIKNRLALENFSGKTAISVKQDFYSTMLITSIESELTVPVNDKLIHKSNNKHQQKVCKSVSFNAIKHKIINLLFCRDIEYDSLVEQLQQLFSKNTIPIRPNRSSTRKSTLRRALHFHHRIKKFVF